MLTFQNLRVEIVKGKNPHHSYISIRGSDPYYKEETRRDISTTGPNHLWLVMTAQEFTDIATRGGGTVQDGYHYLSVMGDIWTFYDMDFPSKEHGVAAVPFVRLTIPFFITKVLRRYMEIVLKTLDAESRDKDRHVLILTTERRQRWLKLYGTGKGEVEYANCDQLFISTEFHADKEFKSKVEQVHRIAENSTYAFWEKARLVIRPDGPKGWYWTAYNPNGKFIMNGGIINHTREDGEKPSWSIHT